MVRYSPFSWSFSSYEPPSSSSAYWLEGHVVRFGLYEDILRPSRHPFPSSQLRSFKTKLFLGLLPLLELLKQRRPDLYPAHLSCIYCSAPACSDPVAFETWDHLWTCPNRKHLVQIVIAQAKASLIKAISKRAPDGILVLFIPILVGPFCITLQKLELLTSWLVWFLPLWFG